MRTLYLVERISEKAAPIFYCLRCFCECFVRVFVSAISYTHTHTPSFVLVWAVRYVSAILHFYRCAALAVARPFHEIQLHIVWRVHASGFHYNSILLNLAIFHRVHFVLGSCAIIIIVNCNGMAFIPIKRSCRLWLLVCGVARIVSSSPIRNVSVQLNCQCASFPKTTVYMQPFESRDIRRRWPIPGR